MEAEFYWSLFESEGQQHGHGFSAYYVSARGEQVVVFRSAAQYRDEADAESAAIDYCKDLARRP